MNYRSALCEAMNNLGVEDKVLFIGQSLLYKGNDLAKTLEGVPENKKIEVPVMEDTQMGMAIGLGLKGYIPVCIFPRFDFLLLATNQLVNQLDKIYELSRGEFNPRVLIRTAVGHTHPINAGPQHTQDHTDAYGRMLKYVEVVRLRDPREIVSSYRKALNSERPTMLVEYYDLYKIEVNQK